MAVDLTGSPRSSSETFRRSLKRVVDQNAALPAPPGRPADGRFSLRLVPTVYHRASKRYRAVTGRSIVARVKSVKDADRLMECIEGLMGRIEQDGLNVVWERLMGRKL